MPRMDKNTIRSHHNLVKELRRQRAYLKSQSTDPRPSLTVAERNVLRYIKMFTEEFSLSPTYKEISEDLHYPSPFHIVECLEQKGYILRIYGKHRTLTAI